MGQKHFFAEYIIVEMFQLFKGANKYDICKFGNRIYYNNQLLLIRETRV